jgi:hypothetical protein
MSVNDHAVFNEALLASAIQDVHDGFPSSPFFSALHSHDSPFAAACHLIRKGATGCARLVFEGHPERTLEYWLLHHPEFHEDFANNPDVLPKAAQNLADASQGAL